MGKNKKQFQKNRAAKRARVNARRQQQKRHHAREQAGPYARLGCTRREIEQSSIHQILITENLFELGLGKVVISRRLANGSLIIGIFLVDVHCQGVKDAFLCAASATDYESKILKVEDEPLIEKSPAYARKLIEGSIAYAEKYGFTPHDDYEEAALILGDIDASACTEPIVFGKGGKPLYVSGTYHTRQQANEVIKRMTAICGPDGFHYMVEVPSDEIEDLMDDSDPMTGAEPPDEPPV